MDHYTVIRKIGEGSFGECFLCSDKRSQQNVVIKEVSMEDMKEEEIRNIERESDILLTMSHPNIVKGYESFKESGFLYIVMNYCEHGELTSLIKRHNKSQMHFEETRVLRWLAQLASALWYIHSKGLIHRDLKSQNIFLDQALNVYIGDFGISRTINPGSMASTFIGSPLYMSPELIQGTEYNSQSDMWSLGCMIFEILCLKTAFQAKNMNMLVMKIISGKIPELPSMYSASLRDICLNLLSQSPEQRMTAEQLCNHELLAPILAELDLPRPKAPEQPTLHTGNAFASRLTRSLADPANPTDPDVHNTHIFDNTNKINSYIKQSVEAESNAMRGVYASANNSSSPILAQNRRIINDAQNSAAPSFKYQKNPILAHIFSSLVSYLDSDTTVASLLISIVRLAYSLQDTKLLSDITSLDLPTQFDKVYSTKAAWTENSCATWDKETELLTWIFQQLVKNKSEKCLSLCRLIVSIDDYS